MGQLSLYPHLLLLPLGVPLPYRRWHASHKVVPNTVKFGGCGKCNTGPSLSCHDCRVSLDLGGRDTVVFERFWS